MFNWNAMFQPVGGIDWSKQASPYLDALAGMYGTAPRAPITQPGPITAAPAPQPADPYAGYNWNPLYVSAPGDAQASLSGIPITPGVNFEGSGVDTSSFLIPGGGSGDSSWDARYDPDAYWNWLNSNGYQVVEAGTNNGNGGSGRGIRDAQGNWIVAPTFTSGDKDWMAAGLTMAAAPFALPAISAAAGGGILGGAAAGATAGATTSALSGNNSGEILRGGLIGGALGGITAGLGDYFAAPGSSYAGAPTNDFYDIPGNEFAYTDNGLLTLRDTLPPVPAPVASLPPFTPEPPIQIPEVPGIGTLPATIQGPTYAPVDPLPPFVPEPPPDFSGLLTPPASIDPPVRTVEPMPETPRPVDPLPEYQNPPFEQPPVLPEVPPTGGTKPFEPMPETPKPVDPLPAPDVTPATPPVLPAVPVTPPSVLPPQSPLDWLKANPDLARLVFAGAGALTSQSGKGGGGGYVDSGYRPNITRGGFLSNVQPNLTPPTSAARGLINIPSTPGYANSGLWRYGLLGGK